MGPTNAVRKRKRSGGFPETWTSRAAALAWDITPIAEGRALAAKGFADQLRRRAWTVECYDLAWTRPMAPRSRLCGDFGAETGNGNATREKRNSQGCLALTGVPILLCK